MFPAFEEFGIRIVRLFSRATTSWQVVQECAEQWGIRWNLTARLCRRQRHMFVLQEFG